MAWVIILVLILANIFVLYLGNQADKKRLNQIIIRRK